MNNGEKSNFNVFNTYVLILVYKQKTESSGKSDLKQCKTGRKLWHLEKFWYHMLRLNLGLLVFLISGNICMPKLIFKGSSYLLTWWLSSLMCQSKFSLLLSDWTKLPGEEAHGKMCYPVFLTSKHFTVCLPAHFP